jgi:hypothetical protein
MQQIDGLKLEDIAKAAAEAHRKKQEDEVARRIGLLLDRVRREERLLAEATQSCAMWCALRDRILAGDWGAVPEMDAQGRFIGDWAERNGLKYDIATDSF